MNATPENTPEPPAARLPRWTRWLLGCCAGLLLLALVLVRLTTLPPEWLEAQQHRRTALPDGLGEAVEHRVLAHASQVTGAAVHQWTITLTQDECNAWLSQRLPLWLAHAGAPSTDPPHAGLVLLAQSNAMVVLEHDAALVGLRLDDGQVGWGRFAASSDGRVRIERAGLGRIPMPLGWLPASELSADAVDVLQGATSLRLGDGRGVRVLHVQLREGAVTIAAETQ